MVKTSRLFYPALITLMVACHEAPVVPNQPAVAKFSYKSVGDCYDPTLQILFENKSENAVSYSWDFGDGTHSTEVNPVKVYEKAGVYKVQLKAIGQTSEDVTSEDLGIGRNSDGNGPGIELSCQRISASSLQYAITVNLVNSTSYILDFGDRSESLSGSGSTIQLNHTYPGYQIYLVSIVAYNESGASCAQAKLVVDPM